eukprot:8459720-Lingulodinium_polyedra.AAC.1
MPLRWQHSNKAWSVAKLSQLAGEYLGQAARSGPTMLAILGNDAECKLGAHQEPTASLCWVAWPL